MKYLLDSNIVSYFYNDQSPHFEAIHNKISSLTNDEKIFVSVLTLYEQEYGYAKAPEEKKGIIRSRILAIETDFAIAVLPNKGAKIFGELKKDLQSHWEAQKSDKANQENMKKHNIDLMLSATAIIESLVLVSSDSIYPELTNHNLRFRYENWTA